MKLFITSVCFICSVYFVSAQNGKVNFKPSAPWYDVENKLIQAHGGGILYHNGTYYWYGENKNAPNVKYKLKQGGEIIERVNVIGISCYTSKDLYNWQYQGLALPANLTDTTNDLHFTKVVERPKVIYNNATKKFVMWMHIDNPDYTMAHSGVAVADNPIGPFTYQGSFRPNGAEARDMALFQDEDGKAYHIYSSEDNETLHISLLSDDYLRESGKFNRIFIGKSREAPAVFKRKGVYYCISSGCTGWNPNAAEYAVANSILGDWKVMGNPAKGNDADKTYYGQSTFVMPVAGKKDTYIFMADNWKKMDLRNSAYMWLPLKFKGKYGLSFEFKPSWKY